MMGGAKAHHDGIKAFSETDQTNDLKAIKIPTFCIQGNDDQIVPYRNAVDLQTTLIRNSVRKVYPGLSHGMLTVNAEPFNADILAFIRS